MARYRHNVYAGTDASRYLVVFDLQWQIIDCQTVPPGMDLRTAMTAALHRLSEEGWLPESEPDFGFVFLNRDTVRRLLILTERDPHDFGSQTFSPFK